MAKLGFILLILGPRIRLVTIYTGQGTIPGLPDARKTHRGTLKDPTYASMVVYIAETYLHSNKFFQKIQYVGYIHVNFEENRTALKFGFKKSRFSNMLS